MAEETTHEFNHNLNTKYIYIYHCHYISIKINVIWPIHERLDGCKHQPRLVATSSSMLRLNPKFWLVLLAKPLVLDAEKTLDDGQKWWLPSGTD